MTALSLNEALQDACAHVGIEPPKNRLTPGRWTRTDSKGKNGKNDAAVLLDDDGKSGLAYNYQTAIGRKFRIGEAGSTYTGQAPQRDARREREEEAQRVEVERICAAIVAGCREDRHAYLDKKGFPDEPGLVCDDPRAFFPSGRFGVALANALPEGGGPFLIIPGRISGKLVTVQFITPEGMKKNILRGQMGGASHRIATGRDTWVCEGIGTALSVRAALRILGASVTVLSAFSASNVGKVAEGLQGSRIAADNDKPVEGLENQGAGEFYARRTGRKWTMPPVPGDFNDMHQRDGLRAVALHLRGLLG
jgi:putative DNA primase/helicase